MICTLIGVKRGIFQNSDGQDVRYGHLFVNYGFDNVDEDCAGQEAAKIKFDYDGVSDLINAGLTYPCKVDLQFNPKGKCTKVILTSDKPASKG